MTTNTTPQLAAVLITPDASGRGYIVSPMWAGVDRPCTGGILCNIKEMRRLEAATKAGKVWVDPKVCTDINGKTYVSATCMVMGRHINADLKRLGF